MIPEALAELERAVERLRSRVDRIYHRTYARSVRRQDVDKRALSRASRWMKTFDRMESGDLIRLGRTLSRIKRRKIVVALDAREYHQLKKMLARRRGGR